MSSSHQATNLLEPANLLATHFDELLSWGCGQPLPSNERIPVHHLIVELALTKPTEIAIVSGEDTITYRELHNRALQIATKLAADGIGAGMRVAILVQPSADMVVAVLGVLYSGAAYVPLDLAHPQQRVAAILADAKVSGVVTDAASIDRLHSFELPLYSVDAVIKNDYATLTTAVLANAEDPAYLIYTSGSTGEPKGVLIEHRQLSDSTLARRITYPGSPTFLLVSPLACDSAMAGLWGTLTAGGKLVIASNDEIRDPKRLIELIAKFSVTQLLCVPSLYESLLDVAERNGGLGMFSLNTVIVAGETLHQSLLQRHFAVHNNNAIALVNEYGPTEATVWATYCRFTVPGLVSIGGPVPGIRLYVLDDERQLVARGVVGELFIGGTQVFQGYFGRDDATARSLLPDPFVATTGARMYRTGDLVQWNDDGALHFVGRRDHQVKIRGHRVELGAIEAVLRAIPDTGIRDAVVVANNAQTQLIAFVLAPDTCATDHLRVQLALTLPAYMVPAKIHVLERFPLTINGKVDRKMLNVTAEQGMSAAVIAQPENSAHYSNDEVQIAGLVAKAWGELLNIASVPADVNFFDLGGHSLMIFRLQDALERHTGKLLPIVSLFRNTTVATQIKLICSTNTEENASSSGQDLTAIRSARALRAKRQRAAIPEVAS